MLVAIPTIIYFCIQVLYTSDLLNINELQACGIARVPMFCYGIYLYKSNVIDNHSNSKWINFFFILMVFFSLLRRLHFFWIGDMLTPFLLWFMFLLCKKTFEIVQIKSVLEFLGKHSLEIYVANMITSTICMFFINEVWGKTLAYIIGNFVLSILLIFINKKVQIEGAFTFKKA